MDISKLNNLIHHPSRLKIMTYISNEASATFADLKMFTGLTDGNLGSHLQKLEVEKLVLLKKTFVRNKPQTTVKISSKGKKELMHYVKTLKTLINSIN